MKTDIIIIGAGPAGISAGIYAKSRGLDVVILEKTKVGGIIGNVSTVTHYSAIVEQETGETFAGRLMEQAKHADIAIYYATVIKVKLQGDTKIVKTEQNTYEGWAVILANGSTPRMLGIPGESELTGHGIGLNAMRNGRDYLDKNIYVVGGADGAIKEAIYLAQFAKKLTVIHFEEKLGAIAEFTERLKRLSNVEVKLQTRMTAVYGMERVNGFELTDVKTSRKEVIWDDGCGIFVYAGLIPNTQMYTQLQLEKEYIVTNDRMETSIPGVYAAGDIRAKQVRQVATAVADGAIAGINAAAYVMGS